MPDLLAHYVVSYLVVSRVVKARYALLFALIGLLPDIDALFRIHRWFTHSVFLVLTLTFLAVVAVLYIDRRFLRYLVLASALYILHIVLDVFVAPTPLLWPLTSEAYMMKIVLNGVVAGDGVKVEPSISITSRAIDFTQQPVVEGPLVSSLGVVISVGVVAILLTERLTRLLENKHRSPRL